MADGGASPGADFIPNNSDALAKPYDLTYPLNAEQVANIDEMLRYLFDSMKEREIEVEAVEADVAAIEADVAAIEVTESELLKVSFSLTEAQIEAANATPIVLVTPGTGIMAIAVCLAMTTTVTTAYSTAPNWRVRYNGQTFEALTVSASGLAVAGPSSRTTVSFGSALQINQSLAAFTATALELSLSVAPGTPGTGVATAKGTLWYQLWDLN